MSNFIERNELTTYSGNVIIIAMIKSLQLLCIGALTLFTVIVFNGCSRTESYRQKFCYETITVRMREWIVYDEVPRPFTVNDFPELHLKEIQEPQTSLLLTLVLRYPGRENVKIAVELLGERSDVLNASLNHFNWIG